MLGNCYKAIIYKLLFTSLSFSPLFITGHVFGKNNSRPWIFQHSASSGSIIRNYDTHIPVGRSLYHEIAALRFSDGSKLWHKSFIYPYSGLAANYASYGNDTVLGSSFSVYPMWIIQGRKGRKLGYSVKLGVGLSYFSNKFDITGNNQNELISSKLTNITLFGANFTYSPLPYISFFAGCNFVHYSNGHTSIPNTGINDKMLSLGLMYSFGSFALEKPMGASYPQGSYSRGARLNARAGRGWHEMATNPSTSGGPTFPVLNFALFASKQLSPVNDIHAGFYCTYYDGYYSFMLLEQMYEGRERAESFVHSVFFGHEFLIGRFGFAQELVVNYRNSFYGQYLFERHYHEQKLPDVIKKYLGLRLSFDYYLLGHANSPGTNVYLGANLKTVVSKADYVEMHIGLKLPQFTKRTASAH
jgi:hypothetical protein